MQQHSQSDHTYTEAAADKAATALGELQQLLRPLGLFRKRAFMLARFSHEYLTVPVRAALC
jgi:hypothetical protein